MDQKPKRRLYSDNNSINHPADTFIRHHAQTYIQTNTFFVHYLINTYSRPLFSFYTKCDKIALQMELYEAENEFFQQKQTNLF